MEERLPLQEADIRILELEGPTIVGHTCKVIRLEAPGIEYEDLLTSVAGRVQSSPELLRRLDLTGEAPAWVPDTQFGVERHLFASESSQPLDDTELVDLTGSLFAQKLDRSRPLWRIDLVDLEGGGSALIWRIHHALADGTTAMRLARQVLWKTDPAPAARKARPTSAGDETRRHRHLLGLFEREFSRSAEPSPFDGAVGTDRQVAFATVSLSALHDAGKKACGATLNDAVLSVLAGAIHHWMEFEHTQGIDQLKVRVPVSLHHGDDHEGNLDSFFSVSLPLNEPDPVRRLDEVRRETAERKADHDAEELDSLLRRISHTSARLGHLYSKFGSNPRRFALSISNVRGPGRPVAVLDAPVDSIHSIAEIGERHALRVAVLSVDDRLCFGFCADPELVLDLDVMAAGVELSCKRLVAAAGMV